MMHLIRFAHNWNVGILEYWVLGNWDVGTMAKFIVDMGEKVKIIRKFL